MFIFYYRLIIKLKYFILKIFLKLKIDMKLNYMNIMIYN